MCFPTRLSLPLLPLPVLAMTFERVIYWQFSSHFWAKKLLSVNQSGFVPKWSCTSLHLHVNDYTLDSFNGGTNVLANFFDLSKALDVLDHGILLKKLECYDVAARGLAFLGNYLSGRAFSVRVGGDFSSRRLITRGVPQESILVITILLKALQMTLLLLRINSVFPIF